MICVLGQTGQLARSLYELSSLAPASFGVCFLGRDQADFTDPKGVLSKLANTIDSGADGKRVIVVNAVAYTAVDRAESEKDLAYQINADTVGKIAHFCADRDLPLVHFSTDYVYGRGGEKNKSLAHLEDEVPDPLSAYGWTKSEGDRLIREARGRHFIFRTSWVYADQGHNFVRTMLRLGAEREELQIVADQVGSPTYATDLAHATWRACDQILSGRGDFASGIYHMAGQGETSWHGLALETFRHARAMGHPMRVLPENVRAIATSDYPTPAVRPLNSRLNQDKLLSTFGLKLPPWQESLRACLQKILGV